MNNKSINQKAHLFYALLKKIPVAMRITLLLLFVLTCQLQAEHIYSQNAKISLDMKNSTIEKVLQTIEEKSDYYFLYNNRLIDVDRKVNVRVRNAAISAVLEKLFKSENVDYEVKGTQIILSPKEMYSQITAVAEAVQQQKKAITGTVIDAAGIPVIGANIIETGTTNGTVTDVDGKFTLSVENNATIQISYIGYLEQSVNTVGQTTMSITLLEDTRALDEVVVVGYGTQKKVNLTGAVDVVSSKQFDNRQASTVTQLLQGASPSVNLSIGGQNGFEPGASMNIQIRGAGSLNGGSPYVLIDGFEGDIDALNPDDIQSISILKDAASSAIYGAKAPYGVILVTTKSGKRNTKPTISYSGNVFLKTPPPLPEPVDSYTWTRVQNEAARNAGSGLAFGESQIDRIIAYNNGDFEYIKNSIPDWPEGATFFGAAPDKAGEWNPDYSYANNNWWDIYYGESLNQKHDLSVSGGSKNLSYYFSAGYLDEKGVLNYGTDTFQRLNTIGKINLSLTDWWDFTFQSRWTQSNRKRPSMTREGDYSFLFRQVSRQYPFTSMYDGFGNYFIESHIPEIETGLDTIDRSIFDNNFSTELRPLKGWKINADFAYSFRSNLNSSVNPLIMIYNTSNVAYPQGSSVPSSISRTYTNDSYWSLNLYSSYEFKINNDHNFNLMGGVQYEKGKINQMSGSKTDMISAEVPSFQTSTGTSLLSEYLAHNATEGLFGRLSYNYKERYLLESNARYDGSYVFRQGKRWGFFPSISAGWNVHNEPFWNIPETSISTLKFRASWGQLGNQNISPYSDLELVPINTGKLNWIFKYGDIRPVGYTQAPGIVNRNLTWETATTRNVGVDISFLKNRLQTNIDLYQRVTTNMVGPSQAKPGVLGASVPRDNNSTLRTRGFDFNLTWRDMLNNGLSYFVGLNLSDNKSVIMDYYNPTGTLSTWSEGRELGEIWGYTVYDLYRTQQQVDDHLATTDLSFLGTNWRPGDVKYEDTNGDGKVNRGKYTIDDHGDLSIIGNSEPHWVYGLNAGFDYKGFDFSMLLRGVAKREIYFDRNSNIYWGFGWGWWESSVQKRSLDYFRDEPGTKYVGLYEGDANINTDAYWPRPYFNGTKESQNKNNPNTRYLVDASYFRIQNLQFGYTLPKNLTTKLSLQSIRLYLSGENLLTLTDIPDGIDPIATYGFYGGNTINGRLTYGADRVYSLGIKITY